MCPCSPLLLVHPGTLAPKARQPAREVAASRGLRLGAPGGQAQIPAAEVGFEAMGSTTLTAGSCVAGCSPARKPLGSGPFRSRLSSDQSLEPKPFEPRMGNPRPMQRSVIFCPVGRRKMKPYRALLAGTGPSRTACTGQVMSPSTKIRVVFAMKRPRATEQCFGKWH